MFIISKIRKRRNAPPQWFIELERKHQEQKICYQWMEEFMKFGKN